MYDKAYRWVAEMEEISDFLDDNPPSRDIYAAIARLYDFLAAAEAEKEPGPDNAVRRSTACSADKRSEGGEHEQSGFRSAAARAGLRQYRAARNGGQHGQRHAYA